jgi:disulfide bond formation protein DsbB
MTDAPHFESPVSRASAAVILVGAATILGAWGFQLAGYAPCPLCLEQRIAYYVGVPIAFIAFVTARRMPASRLSAVLIGLIGLIFLANAVLAAYHAGVEWKLWPGPSDCTGGAGSATDAGSLLSSLNKTAVIACDEAAFRLFGISLAGYNVLISLALAGISLMAAFRKRA